MYSIIKINYNAMSTNFSAEKEFIKDRQRYINIAINSDKRIQILMLVFIIDSHEYILAGIYKYIFVYTSISLYIKVVYKCITY